MRLFLFIALLLPCLAFGQAISEMRYWTHSNGMAIQAELLKLEDDFSTKGTVRLRMKGGATHTIETKLLSPKDRAVILKAWIKQHHRRYYNRDKQTYHVYTKKIPEKHLDRKSTAYFSYDSEKSWLQLQIELPRSIATNGDHLLLVNGDNDVMRIEYNEKNVNAKHRDAIIDVKIDNDIKSLKSMWAIPANAKLYVGDSAGKYSAVDLSTLEKRGISEMINAYALLYDLPTHALWWATDRGKDTSKLEEKPTPAVVEEPVVPSISELQDWTLSNEEILRAHLHQFHGYKIEFSIPTENAKPTRKQYKIEDFAEKTRMQITEQRLSHSLKSSWHPYDDRYTWFWPTKWPEPNQRTDRNLILFAIERSSGEPHLFVQVKHDNTTADSIESCRISSSEISLDIEFTRNKNNSFQLRSSKNTKLWHRLSNEEARLLLVASPGLEKLNFTITPQSSEPIKTTMSSDEFKGSIEALEIYRGWISLLNQE